jgi:hypothetical protein
MGYNSIVKLDTMYPPGVSNWIISNQSPGTGGKNGYSDISWIHGISMIREFSRWLGILFAPNVGLL